MNSVIMIGRLVKDPELRFIPSNGMAVTNFTLAVDKDLSKDKKAEFASQGKQTADFIPVVVYGKIAENCANYLAKGKMTAVSGRIQTRSYTAGNGEKRYVTEVLANKVEFIEWAEKNASSPKAPSKSFNNDHDSFPDFTADDIFQPTDDDDIPF
ncbi:MAG: single-stranded DNA-binding protein [Tissierellales bacterium]|jgi:single-strand DNA-binding protein|nr:single-stranded DNA-binding protein [Tissierellales bacterium]MBN2827799.1 single-stranded DNA-binding protein [Tissierellales bacterium]